MQDMPLTPDALKQIKAAKGDARTQLLAPMVFDLNALNGARRRNGPKNGPKNVHVTVEQTKGVLVPRILQTGVRFIYFIYFI